MIEWTDDEVQEITAAAASGLRPFARCPVCGHKRLLRRPAWMWRCEDCIETADHRMMKDGRVIRGTRSLS